MESLKYFARKEPKRRAARDEMKAWLQTYTGLLRQHIHAPEPARINKSAVLMGRAQFAPKKGLALTPVLLTSPGGRVYVLCAALANRASALSMTSFACSYLSGSSPASSQSLWPFSSFC